MSFDLEKFAAECQVADPASFVQRCEELRLLLEETNKHVNPGKHESFFERRTSREEYFGIWQTHCEEEGIWNEFGGL